MHVQEDMSEDGSPFSELAARKRGLESEESAGLSSEARGRRRLTNSSRASVESQQLLKVRFLSQLHAYKRSLLSLHCWFIIPPNFGC